MGWVLRKRADTQTRPYGACFRLRLPEMGR
jgi:hypothetical protein